MKRTLVLRTESLGSLTTDELALVVGGDALTLPINTCVFCVTVGCVSQVRTQCC